MPLNYGILFRVLATAPLLSAAHAGEAKLMLLHWCEVHALSICRGGSHVFMLPQFLCLPFHSEVGHLFHCYMMDWMPGSGSGASNETSDDLTCAAHSIQEPSDPLPYSRYLVLVMKTYFGFALYSTFIAGSFLNIFLFYLIIRYKKLHTLTFKISVQIVVLELLQIS